MQLFRPGKEMKVRKTKHKAKSGRKGKVPHRTHIVYDGLVH